VLKLSILLLFLVFCNKKKRCAFNEDDCKKKDTRKGKFGERVQKPVLFYLMIIYFSDEKKPGYFQIWIYLNEKVQPKSANPNIITFQ